MKKQAIILTLCLLGLQAQTITLSQDEEKNWQVQTLEGKEVSHVPIGEYSVTVSTPPTLLYTLSVPYEAQVVKLNKVTFDSVQKGEVVALLTATQWVEAQKKVIADAIELMHHQHIAQRKSLLCKEEIIPQKECHDANAEVKTDKIKLSASKTLLKTYGASDGMIETLYKNLTINPTMKLRSPVEGTLTQVNIQPGNSVSPSSALCIIKIDGENWLESDVSQALAAKLKVGQEMLVTIDGAATPLKILSISPILDTHSQTRNVRFSLPKESTLLVGLRTKASFRIKQKAFLLSKKAVVQDQNNTIVFIKQADGYTTHPVSIIAEDKNNCYVAYDTALLAPMVVSPTSVFQNMLQEDE